MPKKITKESVLAKLEAKEPLTRKEERFYMLQVLECPKDVVNNIFAIVENKNPFLIID